MSENGEGDSMGRDLWDEALTWYVTLRDTEGKDLSDALGREWQRWYTDAGNRRVFDDVNRLLADSDQYRKRSPVGRAWLEHDEYDLSIPIAEWRKRHALRKVGNAPSSAGHWWWWLSGGLGVATIAVLFILLPLTFGSGHGHASSAVYQTNVGGLKDIHLPDGSSVTLGGRTKLSITFSTQRRSVSLIEGQAWFKVAHDPRWPFIVDAGDGTITAVGTAFLVTRDSDRVVVTVTEGMVEVSAHPRSRSQSGLDQILSQKPNLVPIRVSRGEELALGDNGAPGPVKPTDTHAATTWTHGRLTFDAQPLRYVVETINRYSAQHIVVSPSAGALRFSGIVSDGHIEDWLQSLQTIFPVTVRMRGADVQIQTRDSASTTDGLTRKPLQ